MNFVGAIDVVPQDREVLVGPFLMEEGDDSLFVSIKQTSPDDEPWTYAFGLLTWRSVEGQELGTVKVYGHPSGETYRLGVGRAPRQRYGDIIFIPRSFNRKWISIDSPPKWSLSFEAVSGKVLAGVGNESPTGGGITAGGVLSDLVDFGVSYAIKDGFAKVLLSQ